ncbi:MAG TPA: SpoIIE family protein phosphatase [Candidatus Baltobacteraceae bacterium]
MTRLFEVPREVRPLVASSIVSNIVLLVLFAAAAIWFTTGVRHAIGQQQNIRRAQVARSAVLRFQIDEESSLRGFELTSDKAFLEPYNVALVRMPIAFSILYPSGTAAGVNPSLFQAERAINARWLHVVAAPLIANPHRADHDALDLRGKTLIDSFRARDATVTAQLGTAADRVDAASARLIATVLGLTLGFGFFIALVLSFYSIVQSRLNEALSTQHDAYEAEKRIADSLQEAFVQQRLPHVAHLALSAIYVPAKLEAQVGGDWYDAFELPDKRILFSIGDVAGHGLDAAVVMSRVRQAIIATALHENDPGVVLARANAALILQDVTMVTALCGFIDPRTFEIRYATAGHPPPLIVADGRAAFLDRDGPPLGALDRPIYPVMRYVAAPDSLLVLYTDGALEYERDLDRGEKLLLQAATLAAVQRGDPSRDIFARLFGDAAPPDDVAILTALFARSDQLPLAMK